MRNKTVTIEFTGELLYLGQTLSKSGPKAASAVMRRMSERQNWFTPLPCADVPDWFLIGHHKSMSPLLSSYRSSSGWSLLRITGTGFSGYLCPA